MSTVRAALAVVTLPSTNGLPADDCTNSFVIPITAPNDLDATLAAAIAAEVRDFYTVADPGTTLKPGTFLSTVIDRGANLARVDVYDLFGHLDGSPHGGPVAGLSFTIPAAGSATPLPNEVAIVVTMEAEGRSVASVEIGDTGDPGTERDRPKQRLTGRIFFGPLLTDTVVVTSGVARPEPAVTTMLRNNIGSLHTGLVAADPALQGLGVWSRKNQLVTPLEAVSTDNEFDTQRRRGRKATSRTRQLV